MVESTVFTAEEAATGVAATVLRGESFCDCGFRWKERNGTVTDLADLRDSHLQHIERWLLGVGATTPAFFNPHSYRHIVEEMIWRQLETLPVHPNSQLRREEYAKEWPAVDAIQVEADTANWEDEERNPFGGLICVCDNYYCPGCLEV